MAYVKDGAEYSLDQIRSLMPNTGIPDGADLTEFGYNELIETEPPIADQWCYITQGPIVDNARTWVQVRQTDETILSIVGQGIDSFINNTATRLGFEDRITLTIRAGYPNDYQQLAINYGVWMDSVYIKAKEIRDSILNKTRELTTIEDIIKDLPSFQY